MLRRNVFIAGVILVMGSIAVTASAQRGGGMFGGGMFGGGMLGGGANLMLLRMPEVQSELNLTADQKTEITTLVGETTEKVRASLGQIDFQAMRDASPEEREKLIADMRKKAEEATKGVDDKVGTIL